ncbi:murein DD-endopeptidase MepM/ murein hydrolase activator NlpD [Streptacidiphilus sp. BW17]
MPRYTCGVALLVRPSRAAWGTVLTVGFGTLLPAALAPFGAHSVAALPGPSVKARIGSSAASSQDALWLRPHARAATRSRSRFGLGAAESVPVPQPRQVMGAAAVLVPGWTMPVSMPVSGATVAPVPGWFSPAPGAAISQPFGVPDPEYAAGYHTGVDFAVFTGTPLYAVADATVVTAGWGGAYGNWIVLRLPDGYYALYAHMSRLDVRTGDHVAGGQQIGLSGESGNARGPHLHFEIRPRNVYGAVIDPLPYLRGHGCHV